MNFERNEIKLMCLANLEAVPKLESKLARRTWYGVWEPRQAA